MPRRPSFDAPNLQIRRGFDPSRSHLRNLAFAFEQALPLIRKNLIDTKNAQTLESLDRHVNSRPVASGGRS
jgi:hypothetical protein